MTLTEKLFEEKIDSENYVGKVQVWRSDVGGHKKIKCKIFKKCVKFWSERLQRVNSWDAGLYNDDRLEEQLNRVAETMREYEDDKEKFENVTIEVNECSK